MIRIPSFFRNRLSTLFISTVAAALLVLTACSDISPAIGKYYTGRTLHVSVVAMERAAELRYNLPATAPELKHYRLAPSEPDLELVMMRIKVENHTATSAIVSIDPGAAELRDFFQEKYFPVDVTERAEEVPAPEDPSKERIARCPVQNPKEVCFLWNATYTDGSTRAFDLQKGFGIDGWMIFEVPKDTEIREMRWRAGDGLTIEF